LSVLGGCGGDGGAGDSVDGGTPPPGVTTYSEVTPTPGSVDTFTSVWVDEALNTVAEGYEERVTAVDPDGSYQLTLDDPSNQTITVNGITYHYNPEVAQYGATSANNVVSGYTDTLPSGAIATCTVAFRSGIHAKPYYVGQTFSTHETDTCGSVSTEYVTAGSVTAVESVTVPAGTFSALKESYSTSWTTASGQAIVMHTDLWMDPAHGFFTLKRVSTYERSGNVPVHHVTTQTIELQSRH